MAALSDVPLTSTKTNSTAAKSWSKIARTVMCTSRSRRVFVYSGGQPSSQLLIHRSSTVPDCRCRTCRIESRRALKSEVIAYSTDRGTTRTY